MEASRKVLGFKGSRKKGGGEGIRTAFGGGGDCLCWKRVFGRVRGEEEDRTTAANHQRKKGNVVNRDRKRKRGGLLWPPQGENKPKYWGSRKVVEKTKRKMNYEGTWWSPRSRSCVEGSENTGYSGWQMVPREADGQGQKGELGTGRPERYSTRGAGARNNRNIYITGDDQLR